VSYCHVSSTLRSHWVIVRLGLLVGVPTCHSGASWRGDAAARRDWTAQTDDISLRAQGRRNSAYHDVFSAAL
jgi:hypothetical protein